MKTIRMVGYAGIVSAVFALMVPSLTITETAQARNTTDAVSVSEVHRVSHTLAADANYSASAPSGYKWGQNGERDKSEATLTGVNSTQSGYKWGNANPNNNLTVNSNYSKQAANPWGRRDFSEQAANPWGRRDFSEQAANPWGRR